MAVLLGFPIIGLLVMLQIAVFSNLTILNGAADIVLIAIIAWSLQDQVKHSWIWAVVGGTLMSLVSAIPFFPYLVGYGLMVFVAQVIKGRIWRVPIIAMFFVTTIGTVFIHLVSLVILQFTGTRLEWSESINLVILPSTLLNLLLALPVYLLVSDLARWVYPVENE